MRGKKNLARLSKKMKKDENFSSLDTSFIFWLWLLESLKSSMIEIWLGLDAQGFLCIMISNGTKTVLDQYDIL